MQRIIYPNSNGGISVVVPTGDLSFEDVCQKDVPAGSPYLIVSVDDIPSDRSFRDAWEADFSNPDGIAMGEAAWRAANEPAKEEVVE